MPDNRGMRASGIEVWAHGEPLVRGIDLAIPPGMTTAVVGESGSGKSLSARALVGLVPDGVRANGELELGGRTVSLEAEGPQISARWRNMRGSGITLLLQDPFASLSPVHTVGRQVRGALKLAGRRVTEEFLRQRIEEVGLHRRVLRQYPHELSGGMRQRVAIVLALAADPAVLIADEPTTALDSLTQFDILTLLDELKRSRQMSVLLISHDLDVVAGHADVVQVMCAGSVMEAGPAAEVLARPVHPYTRGLLAAAPRPGYRLEGTAVPWRPDTSVELPSGAEWGVYASAAELRQGPVPVLLPVESQGPNPHEGGWSGEGEHRHVVGVIGAHADEVVRVPARLSSVVGEKVKGRSTARASGENLRDDIVLRVSALRFSRGSREVLQGVDLRACDGEILGMVGQSGSGKTTVARCIAGLEDPDSGTIEVIGGTDSHRAGAVQMVFQDPAGTLNPALSIRTTLVEALRAAGNTTDTPSALLEGVGLDVAMLTHRPHRLSGGQRQRVAIARALAGRPRLLVCDEAVSALDVSVQAQILSLLRRLRDERQLTMLFITHDLAVVGQLCDRVVVLNEGQVVEEGDAKRLLSEPEDKYTRNLLAASRGMR